MVQELKEYKKAKLVKVYHPKKQELLLLLHMPSKGKSILRITLPGLIYLTDFKQDMPQDPSGFCMFLRKRLAGARIIDLRQVGFERIIEIVFSAKDEELTMAIELFSKGNCIVYDKNRKIVSLLEPQRWKERDILPGKEYLYPNFQQDPFRIDLHGFSEILSNSRMTKIGSALAVSLSLGGLLAEEILHRASIPHDMSPKDADAKNLFDIMKKVLDAKPSPTLYFEGTELKAFSAIALRHLRSLEKKGFRTMSGAVDSVFGRGIIDEQEKVLSSAKGEEVRRLSKILQNQENQQKSLSEKIEVNKRKGELIYENYALVDEIIRTVKKAKEKYSWQEIQSRLKEHKKIKDIDLKTKELTIKL
jgi:predicted ribosome quality control (RQC) complex YloA/Tae2 family protein